MNLGPTKSTATFQAQFTHQGDVFPGAVLPHLQPYNQERGLHRERAMDPHAGTVCEVLVDEGREEERPYTFNANITYSKRRKTEREIVTFS